MDATHDQSDHSKSKEPLDWDSHANLERALLNHPVAVHFPGNSTESIATVVAIIGRAGDYRVRLIWGDRRETLVPVEFLRRYGRVLPTARLAGGGR